MLSLHIEGFDTTREKFNAETRATAAAVSYGGCGFFRRIQSRILGRLESSRCELTNYEGGRKDREHQAKRLTNKDPALRSQENLSPAGPVDNEGGSSPSTGSCFANELLLLRGGLSVASNYVRSNR